MHPRLSIVSAAILLGLLLVQPAHATCLPNSAVLHLRVFNDCPTSVLTTTNLFPGAITIDDENLVPPFCAGFANMHTWRFSADGVNPIEFQNGQTFEYSCTFQLNGVGGEGGLSLSPWWSPDADGLFNVRTTDGEIACFGGRMPFFSFTAAFGLHYVAGTPIQLGISYLPNGLSAVSPAAVVYNVRYMSTNYTSGLLSFDEGNPADDPPHGLWGALTPWYAGGHVKMFVQTINQPHGITATWNDIQYTCGPLVQPAPTIQCPPAAQLACGESTDPSHTGTATVNGEVCAGGSTISHTDAATPANCTGHAGIDRTWSASDACGHTETCVQHITFTDTNAPVIQATGTPADGVLGCNPTPAQIDAALGSATASDDCGDVTPVPSEGAVVTTDCGRSQTRTWTATDACGNPATPVTRTATWTVDPVGATISGVTATPASLWPPNHTMRDVTIDYTVNSSCPGTTTSLSVTSNEPINGTGDGDTSPDWEIVDNHHLRLRAERAGTGSGRIYAVTVTASDGCGKSSTATVAVVVAHNINAPVSGAAFKINTAVNFAGTFWDVPGNLHTAQWMLNTLSVPGTVAEPAGLKSGSVSGNYMFTAPGVYKVTLNLTDQNGVKSCVNTAGDLEAIVVAYDPTAGYTIGGGWFESPAGACPSNPSATGKVSYGFTSKYFKNASNPKGATQFEFKLGGLLFSSLNYSYLTISGARAQCKGFGALNGDASYNFLLTAIDGQLAGGGGTDLIRVKIWNKNTGVVAYDSQMGASDASDPTTAVGPGSTVTIVTTNTTAAAALDAANDADLPTDATQAGNPTSFALTAIRPNPFSGSTEIEYALPAAARVQVTLYSVTGQRLREIVNEDQSAGYRSARLDGRGLVPGIYLVRMRATALDGTGWRFTRVRKVVMN